MWRKEGVDAGDDYFIMVIFIDESGSFSNPQAKSNVISCVGAISIPETCIDELYAKFRDLKTQWAVEGEIKGSQLTEAQAKHLVNLCASYDITLKVIAIDMGLMGPDEIRQHKEDQALSLELEVADDGFQFFCVFSSEFVDLILCRCDGIFCDLILAYPASIIQKVSDDRSVYFHLQNASTYLEQVHLDLVFLGRRMLKY